VTVPGPAGLERLDDERGGTRTPGRRSWSGVGSARLGGGARPVCSAGGCAERAAGAVGEAGQWCPAHLVTVEAVRSAVTQRAGRWVAARLPRHRYVP